MDEKSTRVQSEEKVSNVIANTKGVSSKTLNFLKMFARTYNADSCVSINKGIACLN